MQNPTLRGVNLLEHLNAHVSETKNLGFGYVHVYVRAGIHQGDERMMGTKSAARAESRTTSTPIPRCYHRSLCSNITLGTGTFTFTCT